MQGMHLFEYAIIRVVPRPEREEFINVGVVLYCAAQKYLGVHVQFDQNRLLALYPDMDTELVRANLRAFDQICCGITKESPIAALDPASRFRWLTATRSTVIQTSKVHPGLSSDPSQTLLRLSRELTG